jgi:hypothetical protein
LLGGGHLGAAGHHRGQTGDVGQRGVAVGRHRWTRSRHRRAGRVPSQPCPAQACNVANSREPTARPAPPFPVGNLVARPDLR